MRYAIVESGGKQYKAVEGQVLEVDRLPDEEGAQISLGRVLLMADGPEFLVGTPTVSGVEIKATVVDHIRGPKVDRFHYSPKKRIRVRGGHRQQYTQLMVDFIGRKGEVRPVAKPEPAKPAATKPEKAPEKAAPKEAPKRTAAKATAPKKASAPGKSAGGPARKKTGT